MRSGVMTFLAFGFTFIIASANEGPASIRVVKTWKELENLPPIELGAGVKIRLGLEAAKVPQWSGVLLYCLTEGYAPASHGAGATLGPLCATCQFGEGKTNESEAKWGRAKKDWSKGSYLFARAIPADRIGIYHVTVTDIQRKVIAKGTVEGTKDFFHPWMPWFYLRHGEDVDKNVPAKGIALPTV